ncbi:hypothetical protein Poli38472_011971 [Pythium oligandrum]|uniref:Uncharacterized protein n=1 Tax=Pythium oligandrum TaxID=41045 RepID=A0A8K1FK85_PYTOL|nr:hypothetical protein Poli38472_011971 [Pythium oligandrum]|eukprot:TMW66855.1 hypothetical protein Poli38472_011971 [Pythium oligandrum]
MVTVVPLHKLVAALAVKVALSATGILATPLQYNPSTPPDDIVTLSSCHPAYGLEQSADEVIQPFIPEIPICALIGNVTADVTGIIADLIDQILPDQGEDQGEETDPSQSVQQIKQSARLLEATSTDVARLEQFYGASMQKNVAQLPKSGQVVTTPWPSSYWPIYLDGINYRWNGADPSPAEKYATAFGLNVDEFTRTVSKANGVLSQASRRSCSADTDCASLNDGSACAKHLGSTTGYCIPTWFGICHAWAPAAMLEAEPVCPVTKNNVTFQPFDIKALMTEIYDGASVRTVFTGARFNGNDNAPNNRDKYGRFVDGARRDLGPGFFHIAIANIMGLRRNSFIVDVSAGSEVWNQPVKSYEILESSILTPRHAARQFYRTTRYPFNAAAANIMYVKNRFTWVVEANEDGPLVSTGRAGSFLQSQDLTYLLEVDREGNIIGGEWVGDSNSNHPDFLWFPVARPSPTTVTRATRTSWIFWTNPSTPVLSYGLGDIFALFSSVVASRSHHLWPINTNRYTFD